MSIPESIRPTEFLEEHLRRQATPRWSRPSFRCLRNLALKASRQAKRLNDLRTTLGPYATKRRDSSFARHPVTRVARGGLR